MVFASACQTIRNQSYPLSGLCKRRPPVHSMLRDDAWLKRARPAGSSVTSQFSIGSRIPPRILPFSLPPWDSMWIAILPAFC